MDKPSIIEELRQTQVELSDTLQALSQEQFEASEGDSWSASGYLKHLILSNKPFVKGLNLPKEKLGAMFGESSNGSRSYDDLYSVYKGRLSEGIRAENFEKVTPDFYRLPEGITEEKSYFVETWNETHERLYDALESWEESDLDRYQLPHPAIGNITVREMLYFTIFHNRLHLNDIREASGV
jgi:hypothetical protein